MAAPYREAHAPTAAQRATGLLLRPGVPTDDYNFVRQSWLRNYRETGPAKKQPQRSFYRYHHDIVDGLLHRPDTRVWVASLTTDPDRIYGWLCTSEAWQPRIQVVHYVYVKSMYRGNGLARRLFARAGIKRDGLVVYTFRNRWGIRLAAKVPGSEFMPIEDFLKETA